MSRTVIQQFSPVFVTTTTVHRLLDLTLKSNHLRSELYISAGKGELNAMMSSKSYVGISVCGAGNGSHFQPHGISIETLFVCQVPEGHGVSYSGVLYAGVSIMCRCSMLVFDSAPSRNHPQMPN